jgi:large subunit ribosomal protein L9
MKVILKQDYEKLGKIGDAVNVKDGYAVNYLFPNNIAMRATEGNLKVLEGLKKQHAVKIAKETADAQQLAGLLEQLTLDIKAKASDDENIYGSVNAQIISEALAEKGYNVDKKHIILEEPIKQLGIYTVDVKLSNSVKTTLKVSIVKEQ